MASEQHWNHLVIGLGGTGGSIIRSLRKHIYQDLHRDDPDNVNLQYLYVDSNDSMMGIEDASWKVLGHSVQLPPQSQLRIAGMNLRSVVSNLGSYPGISPWLGNRDAFGDILSTADAANIVGGQKRRLGRFLFACKAKEFSQQVDVLVKELQKGRPGIPNSSSTTFHVCCGLAGGTGSGSLIDTVLQLRHKYPSGSGSGAEYRIILYAVLPPRHPPQGHNKANYHANGYAALLELNALALGLWKPHDVTGVEKERLGVQDPFNGCYLLSDENEMGVHVDLQSQVPEIVASFLYQKIVQAPNINFGDNNTIRRLEKLENADGFVEKSATGEPRRSLKFLRFGVKQISYPEIEIREYLTYSFARESVRQLLYNKWVDGVGFKEEAANQPFEEWVREKSTAEKWHLTDERISLSEGILPAEINNKKWRSIGDFWRTLVPAIAARVMEDNKGNAMKMLPELTRLCDEAFRDEYRGEGVAKFYETKRGGDLREQVREIRGKIERDLFEDWRNGEKSMHDIGRLLSALLGLIEERILGMDDKVAKLGEDTEKFRENEAKILRNRQEWAKLNALSISFGKHKGLINAQAECFITRYSIRTRVEGLRYAKELLITLRQELNELATQVSRCTEMIAKVAKQMQTAVDLRCSDTGREDLTRQVVRFYDPERVKEFARALTTDKAEQRRQTSTLRDRITAKLGDKLTFSSFNSRLSEGALVDLLESTCEENALRAHEVYVGRFTDRGRILNVGLYDLMRKQYEGNEEQLRIFIKQTMDMAGSYLPFEATQVKSDGAATMQSSLTVITPLVADAEQFSAGLERIIKETRPPRENESTDVFKNPKRSLEITFLNITGGFPARFALLVSFLKAEYLRRIESDHGHSAFIELHSEGTLDNFGTGQQLPDLYPEVYTASKFRPWVMLAEAMELVVSAPDATTGLNRVYLATIDSFGYPQMEEIGSSVEDLIDRVDERRFEQINKAVSEKLESQYKHVNQRAQLLALVKAKVDAIAATHTFNDPVFMSSREALQQVSNLISIEAQNAR